MKFYKEKNTNNIISELELKNYDENNFTLLNANTTDGNSEKHIPVYEIQGDKIFVQVGSVEHPMTEEHYIMWIIQVNKNEIVKKELKPGMKPECTFDYIKDSEIYAYCNLHSLWKTTVR